MSIAQAEKTPSKPYAVANMIDALNSWTLLDQRALVYE
jgi:hypothetical protein